MESVFVLSGWWSQWLMVSVFGVVGAVSGSWCQCLFGEVGGVSG